MLPEDTCPLCGGHEVVGAYMHPGPKGNWLWACRACKKAWTVELWSALINGTAQTSIEDYYEQ